jgi:hypothetical protein
MDAAHQELEEVRCQPTTPISGRSFVSRKGLSVNERISTSSLDLCAGLFVQELTPLLASQEPAKMKAAAKRLTYIEKLATLTLQYLEFSLPLPAALRAAEADL